MYYGYIIITYNNKIKYIQPPILVVFILNLKYILFIVTYLLKNKKEQLEKYIYHKNCTIIK
jgi:hypothetical protein